MKRCLGCCRYFPDSDYPRAGRGFARFCDDCRENGISDAQRALAKRWSRNEDRWNHIEARRAYDREYQRRKAA